MNSLGQVQILLKNEEQYETQEKQDLPFDKSFQQINQNQNKALKEQCPYQLSTKMEPPQQSPNTTRSLQVTTEEPLVAKPLGYKKIKKNFQDKQIPDAFFCKGGLQMDLEIFKIAGDNLERTNIQLIQQRQTLTSPFSAYRSPVRVESFEDLGFLEIELEEYLEQFSNFEYLIKRLVDMQTVIAYSNINAIQGHVRGVQKNEILRQSALQMYYKQRTVDNQITITNEKKEQQEEEGKIRIKQEDQGKGETEENKNDINHTKTKFQQLSQNDQTRDKQPSIEKNPECQEEREPLPELQNILQVHKAQTRRELKRILCSSSFSSAENNYYLFVVKCNQQSDLQNVVSSYGISKRLSDLCFGADSNAHFPHFTLSNGIFHPFHDNYSHLQHILVHLLEYQDRQVVLRTIDNYVFQACLRRYVFPLGNTQLLNTNGFTLMDHMIVHQFLINPQQIQEIQKSRQQRKILDQQMQNLNSLSPADVEYTQAAFKFVEKYKSHQESETNCSHSHRKSKKIKQRQMETRNKNDKQGKSYFNSSSANKKIGVLDGTTQVDYDSHNCQKDVPKVAELINTIVKEEME